MGYLSDWSSLSGPEMSTGSEDMGWSAQCVGHSTGLLVPATPLSSSCPDGLALLGSFVGRVAPLGPVLCGLFPVVWSNAEGFQRRFQSVFEMFSLASI